MDEWNIPLFEIGGRKLKLFQGGMGVKISASGLASAVANEGGLGIIATVGLNAFETFSGNYEESSAKALIKEIELARGKMNGQGGLGVNIMRPLTNYKSLVETSINSGIEYIISGAAPALDLPSYRDSSHQTCLIPIVSSAKSAGTILKFWKKRYNYVPETIVAEGPLAGGHLGFKPKQIFDANYSLEKIIPEVVEAVKEYGKIEVIAAGGIFYGGDIKKFLRLGASGVQMATRFVTTHECDADIKFKQAYVDCKPEDIIIIQSPVGLPGRAIRNKFLDEVKAGKKHPVDCPYYCLISCKQNDSPYCIAHALVEAAAGRFEEGYVFVGANAHLCKEIISVKQVFERLNQEYMNDVCSS
jgi:nitronate monooxygenase